MQQTSSRTLPRLNVEQFQSLSLDDVERFSEPLSASNGDFMVGSLVKPILQSQWTSTTPRTKDAMEQLCIKPEQLGFRPLSSFGSESTAVAQFRATETSRQELTKQLLALCGNMKTTSKLTRLTTRISHQPTKLTILPSITATDLVMKINNLPPPASQQAPAENSSTSNKMTATQSRPSFGGLSTNNLFPTSSAATDDRGERDEALERTAMSSNPDWVPPPKPEISQYCLHVLSSLPQVRNVSSKHQALAQRSREKLERQVQVMSRRQQFLDAARVTALQRMQAKEAEEDRRFASRVEHLATERLVHTQRREGLNALREQKLRTIANIARAQSEALHRNYKDRETRERAHVEELRAARQEDAAAQAQALQEQLEVTRERREALHYALAREREELGKTIDAKVAAGAARSQTLKETRNAALQSRDADRLKRTMVCDNHYAQASEERRAQIAARMQEANERVAKTREVAQEQALQQAVERMHRQEQIQSVGAAQLQARKQKEEAVAQKYVETDTRVLTQREALLREALNKREAAAARAARVKQNQERLAELERRYLHQVATKVAEGTNRVMLAQAEQELYVSKRQAQTSRLLLEDATRKAPSTSRQPSAMRTLPKINYGPGGAELGPNGRSLHPLLTRRQNAAEERRKQSMAQVSQYLAEKR